MKVEIYKDRHGLWRWRLIAKNGKITADSGESYYSKWGAKRAVRRNLGL